MALSHGGDTADVCAARWRHLSYEECPTTGRKVREDAGNDRIKGCGLNTLAVTDECRIVGW